MNLTLGAIPYGWGVEEADAFYVDVAGRPVDTIVLGEVLCTKRRPPVSRIAQWAELLTRAGKRVRLGSFSILTTSEEMAYTKELCGLPYPMEVNHVAVLELCRSEGKPFVIGPHVAIYNQATAAYYAGLGAQEISLHPELTERAIRVIVRGLDCPVEVLCLGRLPLANSWRCFTARAHRLAKRDCRYICREHPEGIVLETLDGVPLWIANGTQMMSARHYVLLEQVQVLRDAGVSALRIDPHPRLALAAVDVMARLLWEETTAREGLATLYPEATPGFCNGWFFGQEGIAYVDAP